MSTNCGNDGKRNKCSICDETFESRAARMDHIATKHEDIKLFQCSNCDYKWGNIKKGYISFSLQVKFIFNCLFFENLVSFSKKKQLKNFVNKWDPGFWEMS